MAGLLSFFIAVILVSGVVRSDDCSLTPFAKKVRSMLSDDTYHNIFNVSYKDPDELIAAVQKNIVEFNQHAGVTLSSIISEELKDKALKVRDSLTSDIFFRVHVNGVSRFLKDQGKLTKDNGDKLAELYAYYLKKEAKRLEGKGLLYTLPAVNRATAEFFKREDIYGDQTKLQKFEEHLFSEVDKNC